jgi:hypothetical protein
MRENKIKKKFKIMSFIGECMKKMKKSERKG